MWSHGAFYWNELMTRDVERAKRFYADAIGWQFEPMAMAGQATYCVAKVGERPVAGIFDISGAEFAGMPEQWMSYLAVDDVDARVQRAAKAGAQIMREPFNIPGVGRIAIIREPGGADIGWMTPAN